MRRFTKYPSNYVKADTNYKDISDQEFNQLVDSYKGERSWSLIVAELKGTYGLDMAKKVADAVIDANSSSIKASDINISGWLNKAHEEPAYTSGHWEAIAEFSDGSRLEFTKPCTVKGWQAEDDQQYDIECELLDKAAATGKEIVFYTVNFVGEE